MAARMTSRGNILRTVGTIETKLENFGPVMRKNEFSIEGYAPHYGLFKGTDLPKKERKILREADDLFEMEIISFLCLRLGMESSDDKNSYNTQKEHFPIAKIKGSSIFEGFIDGYRKKELATKEYSKFAEDSVEGLKVNNAKIFYARLRQARNIMSFQILNSKGEELKVLNDDAGLEVLGYFIAMKEESGLLYSIGYLLGKEKRDEIS